MRTRSPARGLLALLCLSAPALAEVRLPAVFDANMVLQRDVPLAVWGRADAGEKVTVAVAGRSRSATADAAGRWALTLDPMAAGGPHTMTVGGTNRIELGNVMVGEVWLCSGQSNMAMTVSRCKDPNAERGGATFPGIRMMTVKRVTAETPQGDCEGTWTVCSPETVGRFSGTAYFFGRALHKALDVPVGLINASWGGTPVQAWTADQPQRDEPKLQPLLAWWTRRIAAYDPNAAKAAYQRRLAAWQQRVERARAAGRRRPRRPRPPVHPRRQPHRPGNLYNAMIAPLAPYTLRGALWYQGEANAKRYDASLYGLQLRMMIANWRALWGREMPFLWVQLPNFMKPQTAPVETGGWVVVQEQMLETLAVAGTGMAVTIDIGEARDIHPANKQDVGRRLARWALASVYGKDVVRCGPLYKSMRVEDGRIVLSFGHVGGGLVCKGEKLDGFAIAGADRTFVWADAKIVGETVVVSSPDVPAPVACRYAWASNPKISLFNAAGLPAAPFRTDDWKLDYEPPELLVR